MNKPNVKIKSIRIYGHVNDKLDELVKARKEAGHLIDSRQIIVADLILNAHKKEVK